jgi:hypothetical protein
MSKLFQIYEEDLQRLEYALPRIAAHLGAIMNRPEVQVLFEECKEVVGNVRWNYGPHTNTEVIEP